MNTGSLLQSFLADAFTGYEQWLVTSGWRGKEHDCVNAFVCEALYPRVTHQGPVFDIAQVAIESAIPQGAGLGIKQAVRKDLVIWPRPNMTTWNQAWKAEYFPMAVIEWKVRRKKSKNPLVSLYDLDWMVKYSRLVDNFMGCCVTVDFSEPTTRLETVLVVNGETTDNFHISSPVGALPL